jgi:hypothetical protein
MKIHLYVSICMLFLIACSTDKPEEPNELKILSVEEWGGVPFEGDSRTHEIIHITLHHSGGEFTREKDPAETLRNLQSWSRNDRNWIDIPYHYLIDLDGNIYQGRNINYPGDTNTNYDPTGHALICVLGNYEIAEPNERQLEAVVSMMARLCEEYGIDPSTIRSHRDYVDYTICPGENIYSYLSTGYFREEVNKRLK